MPILPDVEGVLFELLLLAARPGSSHRHSGPQPIDIGNNLGGVGSRSRSTPDQPDGHGIGNASGDRNRQEDADSHASTANATPSRRGGETRSTDADFCLGSDRGKDTRACILVGAVALLLSEVVDTWRTMESPLFDCAGSVVGNIKLAAKVSGLETRYPQKASGAEQSETIHDVVHVGDTPAAHEIRSTTSAVPHGGATVAVASSSPEKSAKPRGVMAKTEQHAATPPYPTGKSQGERRGRQEGSAHPSGSQCRNRRRGSSSDGRDGFSSPGGGRRNDQSRQGDFPNIAVAAAAAAERAADEDGWSLAEAEETNPRAVILYRGVRLPFRWFRSGTAESMEVALREMLGKYHCGLEVGEAHHFGG